MYRDYHKDGDNLAEYKAQQLYDKYKRNKEAKHFYNSAAWKRCREIVLIRDNYLCQECFKQGVITQASVVHHIKPLEDYPELALVEENLSTICPACHNKEHPEKGGGEKKTEKNLNVVEFKANPEMT